MTDKYILHGKEPVLCNDIVEWGSWLEAVDRHVASDKIGDVRISTVFIGLDLGWGDNEEPLLFETMIFGGKHDDYQERCSTWEQAEKQHAAAVALVRSSVQ